MGSSRQPGFHTWLFTILPSLQCLLEIIPNCFQSGSHIFQLCHSFLGFKYIYFLRQTILCKLDIDQSSWGLMSVSEDGEIFPNPFLSLPRQPYVNLTKHPCKQNKTHANINKWKGETSLHTQHGVSHTHIAGHCIWLAISQVKWNNFMPFIWWKHHCYWKIRYTN